MTRRMNHLLIFGSVAIVAWIIGTLLLVYLWPHLVNNIYKKAILSQGFGEGPVPINTLYHYFVTFPCTNAADSVPSDA
jgi:hypothetical protein